ncbi:PAS domain-containing protein [Halopenitus sp. H-Gu1]|uniref:hybrid sensor histidine kinase/response regulator n=1 Tax=Halopenitus sp. H-Gu1 TaxID=3242697 RepID=UPI00359E4FF9
MNATTDRIRVLHVDDEPDFADMAATFLERESNRITVHTATTPDEGLELLADHAVDCIVSDYDMPGQDGIEFLQAVRENYPDLPFILYTGKGSEAVASTAISSGVTDYLQKETGTSQYEVLANRIRNTVSQFHTRKELDRSQDLLEHAEQLADVGGWEIDVETGEQRWTEGTYTIHDIPPDSDFEPTVDAGVEFYHPDDQAEIRRLVERCIETGEPFDVEARLLTADDRLCWVRAIGEAIQTDGDIVTIRGAIRDITDRKEREQDLRQYEFFVEHSPDQIALLDEELTVQYQSPISSLHELDAIEIEGEDPLEYIHPDDQQILSDHFEDLLANPNETFSAEFRAKDVSGEWRWVETRGKNLLGEEPVDGILAMIRDVTQRNRQRHKLKRQNEFLDEFTSVVSHDLRNPLNVARGRVELAQQDCDSEHLEDAVTAIDRSFTLIEELLTVSHKAEDVSEVEPVEMADTLDSCWRNVETGTAALVIETEQTIQADASRLKQLLENLISNAVTHGGERVTVTVGDLTDGFYVADDAAGIPADEREAVFDIGYSTAEDGTGLGLNIVQRIVEAHGWEISITDSIDGGARFEITGVEFAA